MIHMRVGVEQVVGGILFNIQFPEIWGWSACLLTLEALKNLLLTS